MKITISPTGEIHMETNGSTPAEIAGVILSVQRELAQKKVEVDRPAALNDLQGETYDFLVANDSEHGVHLSAVAREFGLTNGAASHRLEELMAQGFVRRIKRGNYRAVTE